MKIAFIGSGNVANVFAKLFVGAGHTISHIAGRNSDEVQELSVLYNSIPSEMDGIKYISADILIMAVSDNAIKECLEDLHLEKTVIVHAAGSVSRDVLKPASKNYGVMYPMQSLRKDMDPVPQIPFLIDANNDYTLKILEELAGSISSSVRLCNDEERIRLHAAAVVVSNFTNHLYTLAEEFCIKENIDFKLLLPLIEETSSRLKYGSPATLQTGPAQRQDMGTIDRHMDLLKPHAKLRDFYIRFTDSIINH